MSDTKTEEKKPAAAVKKSEYVVAPGKSITATKTRVLGEGQAIEPSDLSGGKLAFDNFVQKKYIVKA